MRVCRLRMKTLTEEQFRQIVMIEENCGLEPYTPEMLQECIEELDTYGYLENGRVLGFITVHPSSRYLGGGVYIVNLNVEKNHRRQGIGEKLILEACGSYANSHRGSLVTLDVAKDNTAAMSLYKKLGFFATDLPSGNGDTDLVMAIPIERMIK